MSIDFHNPYVVGSAGALGMLFLVGLVMFVKYCICKNAQNNLTAGDDGDIEMATAGNSKEETDELTKHDYLTSNRVSRTPVVSQARFQASTSSSSNRPWWVTEYLKEKNLIT